MIRIITIITILLLSARLAYTQDIPFHKSTVGKDNAKIAQQAIKEGDKYMKMDYTMRNEYFLTTQKSAQPMREARISIFYRFGSMKEAIKKVQRTITNDDVMGGGEGGAGGGAAGGGM